jgi:hypothetical protein
MIASTPRSANQRASRTVVAELRIFRAAGFYPVKKIAVRQAKVETDNRWPELLDQSATGVIESGTVWGCCGRRRI